MKKHALEKGEARVQFLALQTEIKELLRLGHTIRKVHSKLRKEKKISMSYSTLTEYLRKENKNYQVTTKPVEKPKTMRSSYPDNTFKDIEMSYNDKY